MKRILCYGDSNTWGYDPLTQTRFDERTRWTRVLAAALGSGYEIIEEGLNGRTTVWDHPVEGELASDKNGRRHLGPYLQTHASLDGVIVMLGTNDLMRRFALPASDIAVGVKALAGVIQRSSSGRAYVASPVLLLGTATVCAADRKHGAGRDVRGRGGEVLALRSVVCRGGAGNGVWVLPRGQRNQVEPIRWRVHFEAGEHAKLGIAPAAWL